MKLAVFKLKLKELEDKVAASELAFLEARKEYDDFLYRAVGFKSGSTATLDGTINMIEKIIEMKAEA